MLRVLVLANDSLLADAIKSMLAEEIDLDVVRVTRRELGKGDPHSVVIVVDEGESDDDTLKLSELFRDEVTLLVIKISLKSRNIHIYESYQLNNPASERVINLVRDFSRANLKKNAGDDEQRGSQKKIDVTRPVQTQGHDSQQSYDRAAHLSGAAQAIISTDHWIDKGRELSSREISVIVCSLFLHYLRRKNVRNVTRRISSGHFLGFDL